MKNFVSVSSMLTIAALCGALAAAEKPLPEVHLGNVRREPVAAARHNESPIVAIACAKSGTLIFWDWKRGETKQEFAVGQELRNVAAMGSDEYLLLDSKANELIQVRHDGEKLWERHRHPLPLYPVGLSVAYLKTETQIAVTSLWARQVTIWKSDYRIREPGPQRIGKLQLLRTIDLPFEPRLIAYGHSEESADPQAGASWQVADAFGGGFADIRLQDGKTRSWQNSVHNIGGLYKGTFGYLVTHQRLRSSVPITETALASGELLQNRLAEVNRGAVLRDDHAVRAWPLGVAAPDAFDVVPRPLPPQLELKADPAGISQWGWKTLVCLAGTDEVAVLNSSNQIVKRLPAGKRPRFVLDLWFGHSLVLGELDDSVTLVDASELKGEADLPQIKATTYFLHPRSDKRELSPAERGERLFFSAKISAGQRMSCHSCHPDGHTNGLLADTLGDNTHGTPKRTLTLRGTRLTDLWAWNGEMKTLQDNVHKSLQDTLHAPEIKPADVDDIVSFLHTLPPVPPLKPTPRDEADRLQVERGRKIFFREACDHCHVPPLTYTSHASYDVGLADEKGLKKFNPPSLRGVGRLKGLLHDNRASSLADVFETHGHQLKEQLLAGELADLVRFLESL